MEMGLGVGQETVIVVTTIVEVVAMAEIFVGMFYKLKC